MEVTPAPFRIRWDPNFLQPSEVDELEICARFRQKVCDKLVPASPLDIVPRPRVRTTGKFRGQEDGRVRLPRFSVKVVREGKF